MILNFRYIFNNQHYFLIKPPCTIVYNKEMKIFGGFHQEDVINNNITHLFSDETSMYYHSQQENENIWRFHQNNVIINKITQLFSDETSMSYRSQQENENIWGFHQNDVINNKITQIFSDE